ncbi:MAG: hypothetical protein GX928_03000, partial [Ruminococcaceae bacterium]|nr:hypothetical protein [Oscillospiraceae bacterium]
MLRIFVTGDNHIGLKYANYEKSSLLADSRTEAFRGMIEYANNEKCDLFVITGDLFHDVSKIPKKNIKLILDILSDFSGHVIILPGNHDFYDKDADLWRVFNESAKSRDNVILLTDYRPYEIEAGGDAVILYPALCTSKHSAVDENNLGWIKDEGIIPDSNYRIGIAHGAVEGETIDKEGKYFLMTRSELEDISVDVWLIGHTHVPFPRGLSEEYTAANERIFNAGTHQQTDVNNNTQGICFIVEISKDKKIRAKKFISGKIRFYRREIALTAGEMEEILIRELADIGDNNVVDIILSGAVTLDEYEDRRRIIEGVLSRFIEASYDDYALNKLISK